MMRQLVRGAAVIMFGFGLLVSILRAGAADDEALRTFLLPAATCPAPSWQGIRPGASHADEAQALLIANPWITSVNRTPTHISWRWSGAQPAYIDADAQGILYLANERVATIVVGLTAQYGDIWALFGAPPSAIMVRPASRSTAYQIVNYPALGVELVSSLSCPVRPDIFWAGETALRLGTHTFSEAMNGVPYAIFDEPGWWRWLHTCQRQAAN